MKSLYQFIQESAKSSKVFTFRFKGVDNADEIIKTLSEDENLTIDDYNVELEVSIKTINNVMSSISSLEQIISQERKGTHSSNNEHYSNIITALNNTLNDVKEYINELQNPEDTSETAEDSDADDTKK